jgi:hypothetical protein
VGFFLKPINSKIRSYKLSPHYLLCFFLVASSKTLAVSFCYFCVVNEKWPGVDDRCMLASWCKSGAPLWIDHFLGRHSIANAMCPFTALPIQICCSQSLCNVVLRFGGVVVYFPLWVLSLVSLYWMRRSMQPVFANCRCALHDQIFRH